MMTESDFEREVEQHRPGLVHFARRLVGEIEAEDLVQEALLVAWNNRERLDYRPGIEFFAYLRRGVLRKCIDTWRRRKREDGGLKHLRALSPKSTPGAEAEDPARDLLRAAEEFGEEERKAVMELFDGATLRGLAEGTHISRSTFHRAMSPVLNRIRERLGDYSG